MNVFSGCSFRSYNQSPSVPMALHSFYCEKADIVAWWLLYHANDTSLIGYCEAHKDRTPKGQYQKISAKEAAIYLVMES